MWETVFQQISHPILTFCIYGSTRTHIRRHTNTNFSFQFLKVMCVNVCVSVYLCLCVPHICQCKSGSEYGIQSFITEIKGNYEPPAMGAGNSHPTGRAGDIKYFLYLFLNFFIHFTYEPKCPPPLHSFPFTSHLLFRDGKASHWESTMSGLLSWGRTKLD